jgi:acetamidase/formamidase
MARHKARWHKGDLRTSITPGQSAGGGVHRNIRHGALIVLLLTPFCTASAATYHLPSTPATVHRSVLSPKFEPVLKIRSGDSVTMDTVSHGGLTTNDPVKFFARDGIAERDVLKDAVAIAKLPYDKGFGGHVLTGPIYMEGAEPGDMLEVRIKAVKPRVTYGVNNAGSTGAAPDMFPKGTQGSKTIKYDAGLAKFAAGITFPLRPFLGTMAVAPTQAIPSRAPGLYGGNMDFQKLQAGSTLYLPVLVKGALFVAGDPHASQGDGEVSGNALESSMQATLDFILHKGEGKAMTMPFAEDKENYYVLGMAPDLDKALSNTIKETVKFLGARYGLKPQDAYSLCSTAIDFGLAEAVDLNLVMYSKVPKSFFAKKTHYWK